DWLHHTNQSLTRLKDVKKTSIWLNGGPHEREVNCQCSYRSKSRDSFLSLETGPPQLHIDSQETASMKDLSVPEIMKQFHERQKSKLKRRPQSSTVYSSRSAEKKQDWQKPSENNYSAFISVKGQTVTPQHRPPLGSLPLRETKKDNTSYKGLVYLDRQQEELDRSLAPHDLWRYSAAFCEDEDSESTNPPPPPPRASPEPSSPKLNWPEVLQSAEEAYSEEDDDDDLVDESQETRSISSAGSRSLVFAIPTGGNEGTESDDEQTPSLLDTGRGSSDYVARSESMLHKICDKSQAESAVISDMLVDMKSTNEKISQLRISPRDLDLELTCDATTPSVLLAKMEIECTAGTDQESTPQHEIEYETMWVEEPQVSNRLNALSNRFPRACSARYMTQQKTSRVRKQQSESSLALKGKTMEFFNPEDLVAKNLSRDQRKNPRHNDFTGEEHEMLEMREDTDPDKVVTKPPLPKWNTSKTKKRHKLKQKRQSGTENSSDSSILDQPSKSSLRKSSSEGNIHLYQAADTNLSPGSNLKLKSVTFRRDVLSQVDDVKIPLDSSQLPTYSSVEAEIVAKPAVQTCAWSQSSGVVINNGLEMKEANLQEQEISAVEITDKESRLSHTRKTAQSSRAKLLAKMKELPGDEELCPCRTVTRPTTALITELRNSKSRTKETSLKNDKLLKHRVTRPSSAPLKRSSGNGDILRLEKPHSPGSKPRAMSAKGQRKRTGSEGGQTRSRPSSAHVGKLSSKDARRSRAAAKVLKDGFLFKEKPPPPLPAASKESQKRREEHGRSKQDNNNKSLTLPWNKEEEIVASEECHEVFARLQEKGIDVSMDTIKRGLMAPARRAGDYQVTGLSLSSNLLSRPENWLTEEHARVQIWEKAL
ncbi:hypothetical protein pdam_00010696, partial [Pocillopora damicornis]